MNRPLLLSAILIVTTLIIIPASVSGRDFEKSVYNHRIVSVNPGFAFSDRGDHWGIGGEISHLKTIFPFLYHRESISSWVIYGNSWIDGGYEHQNGMEVSFELGLSPLKMRNSMLSVSAGGCLAHHVFNSPNYGRTQAVGSSYVSYVSYDSFQIIDPGYILGLNYHSQVNRRLWVNARASIRIYRSGPFVSMLSVGLGLNPSK